MNIRKVTIIKKLLVEYYSIVINKEGYIIKKEI